MRQGSVIGTSRAVADVDFERVRPLLTEAGARRLLNLAGRDAGLVVGADPGRSMVWIRGTFWYQGEYEFAPHAEGTAVEYRIRNVSGWPDTVIRLWQRGRLRSQQADLDKVAARLPGRV